VSEGDVLDVVSDSQVVVTVVADSDAAGRLTKQGKHRRKPVMTQLEPVVCNRSELVSVLEEY
jgi:intracellular sulfur oxidation DsrE/DsrF family protein